MPQYGAIACLTMHAGYAEAAIHAGRMREIEQVRVDVHCIVSDAVPHL